jgi:hypothetical protein
MNDVIVNGVASGTVASVMLENDFSPNCLRPYVREDGASVITVNKGSELVEMVTNAPATLRKDDWIQLDTAIVKAAKQRLRVVSDMRSRGLVYNIPNGMAKTVLQTEAQSDISEADLSMDGLRQSQNDRPEFSLTNLPLPIIHKDFSFSARQIAASRNGGSPLDTTTAELAARRVAEIAEKLTLGVHSSYQFGGGTIYGLTNHPARLLKSLTDPTGAWTPDLLVKEVLEMRTQSQNAGHFGSWTIYTGLAWDSYLDDDYSAAKGDNTLRDRIAAIKGITGVETADYLTGFDLIMVQNTSDVARQVVGMDITTVQWESMGGLQTNFKVMAILVPQVRADFNGNTGLVHGSV